MNGINTGKLIIGSAYAGQKRQISHEEAIMQRIILAQMPANAVNRAAIVSLTPEAYQHIGSTEKTWQRAFKRFSEILEKISKVFA